MPNGGDPSLRCGSVLHVDADAFFASVEQLLEPSYRNKPLIVGGSHRGVVSSASYEARKFGIHSAMPIYKARKLCPKGIFVRGNHKLYGQFSRRMFDIFQTYTPTVEMNSIDEGYIDLSGTTKLHKADYPTIAMRLLRDVYKTIGITISGGLSSSKMVSKIASSLFKPRQFSWIHEGYERTFLAPLPIKKMPGIGPKSFSKFERLGIHTIGDLAAMNFEAVWQLLGGQGIVLWERAQGLDRRPVSPYAHQRKSISEDKTFPLDIDSQDILLEEAIKMIRRLCFRLREKSLHAHTLTLKIRYADFQTFTHRKTLPQSSNIPNDFLATLRELLTKRDPARRVRLIGVCLSNLQNQLQLELFGEDQQKRSKLEKRLDTLRNKYGPSII